jgi:hypothetical protein
VGSVISDKPALWLEVKREVSPARDASLSESHTIDS